MAEDKDGAVVPGLEGDPLVRLALHQAQLLLALFQLQPRQGNKRKLHASGSPPVAAREKMKRTGACQSCLVGSFCPA